MPGSLVSCSLYDVTLLSLCTRRRFSLPSFDCVSVLSAFLHDVLKTDAARITDLDIQMLHYESWKSIYFGSKDRRSRSRVTQPVPAWVFALL